jgi:hypothetical protein
MTDLLDRVLSVATIRTVVRGRCCPGVSGPTISRLVASYAPADAVAGFANKDRSGRLPVELVPPHRRVALLAALQRLPVSRTAVLNRIATLQP